MSLNLTQAAEKMLAIKKEKDKLEKEYQSLRDKILKEMMQRKKNEFVSKNGIRLLVVEKQVDVMDPKAKEMVKAAREAAERLGYVSKKTQYSLYTKVES